MAAVVYTCHIWNIFYEIHETFKEIHIMEFHCNKYPYTIKHRVFLKTFGEFCLKDIFLKFYQTLMTAVMAFIKCLRG